MVGLGGTPVSVRDAAVVGQTLGGRLGSPRRISSEDDEAFIVAAATTRPQALDQPFTRWSLRNLVGPGFDSRRRLR